VFIHMKISERNQFLHETPSSTKIDDLIKDLVLINNLRVNIDILSVQIEELYKNGPLKPEEERGLDKTLDLDKDIDPKYKPKKPQMPNKVGDVFVEDSNHYRTGWTFNSDTVNKRLEEVKEIKMKISSDLVQNKKVIKIIDLTECIDMLRAVVYLCYPGYNGLPEWEPCKVILESKENLLNKEDSTVGDYVKYDSVTLWCAGREYERHKFLSDYTGKNEKTKVVCKFSNKGSGAPVREPPVDSETQKKMMQIYHRKQEEMKKLETNTEDDYLNAKWADPKGLKSSLYTGGNDVSWKYK